MRASGEQCQLAGDKTSCIARSDAVRPSVDCYFGLERERGELKGVAGGDEADANLCASFRPPIDFHIADDAFAAAATFFLDDVGCVPPSQIERFQG